MPKSKVGVSIEQCVTPGLAFGPGAALNGGTMASPENEAAVREAMARAVADAQARQDYYKARIGVPAGTVGSDPQPLPLPEDRATTGAHSVPGVQGGAR